MTMTQSCAPLVTVEDVDRCCKTEAPEDTVEWAIEQASFVVWSLSGRRYGLCPVTAERPGRPQKSCCERGPCTCGCPAAPEVWLGCAPVESVTEVRIGGDVVTDWRLIAPNRLIRTGGATWPACQLLADADDDPDVLTVDYMCGIPLDPSGSAAAAGYACQLARACCGEECDLPERVTSVTRQGVSFQIQSSMSYLDKGRTGYPPLDLWLSAVNPDGLRRRSRVRSPDIVEAETWV